ncbi:esterase/lipase family protein [Actinokineospora sp.]|uniref:esterase/lipase family protein n=1 Tax=Actinokineospora sp. TaxID=1872133 RepID=UPI004037B128
MPNGAEAPSLGLYLTEPARGVLDLAALPLAAPWLYRAPRGEGRPVLVLPGLLAGDASTAVLRTFLRHLGHRAYGWRLGRNYGPGAAVMTRLPAMLTTLAERHDGPVSIVGWSLGGIYARELARQNPSVVRQVITLGSPFAQIDDRQSRAQKVYDRYARSRGVHPRTPTRAVLAAPIDVPVTAVHSRRDGIVHWQTCVETPGHQSQNVRVRCSHLGYGHDPAVLWLIADRLAATTWRPFEPPRALRMLYPATP